MIIWNTPTGSLGTFKELDYNEIILDAYDTYSQPLEYTHISGTLPPGMYITTDGKVKGVPTITGTVTKNSATYVFTVRANNPAGDVADRSFSIKITNQSVLTIYPRSVNLGTFDDGSLISYQFNAVTENPETKLTWSVVSGKLPNDIRTGTPISLDQSGLLQGYISRLVDTGSGTAGYSVEADDSFPYDFSQGSKDKVYSFVIQVTDGYSYDSVPVTISVISKGNFTSDNSITLINNTSVTVDADNRYVPIITSDPTQIPVLQEGSKFSFQFHAIDPEDSAIQWRSNAGLPNGLTLSSVTGWLTGTIPLQSEEEKTYTFTVSAYKRDNPTYASNPLVVNITTVRDATNYITWITNPVVGTMVNGSASEFKIEAVSNLGKSIIYTKLDKPNSRLPQGLKMLNTGEIIGRASFQYFSIDGYQSRVTVQDTANITVGMIVEGPGVASGSKVVEVINSHTVMVRPAIHVVEGTEITFRNLLTSFEVVTRTTDLNTTTTIDGGKTTFDSTYTFSVKAVTADGTASATKEFSILLDNYNKAPYENVYLKALPSQDQRTLFKSIINNQDIFPDALIYRPRDPWFGKASDIRMLFLPGLTTSDLDMFAQATEKNHYNKRINFGNVKTARAVDANFNTKYEVVYLEVEDQQQYNGSSAALSFEPAISRYFMNSYHTIYPNSFTNMQYRLASDIGYSNRGALPDWMTSPQEDGRVLGLVRGVVLAYTIPGASKLIAYRLKNNGINFNTIDFVADRYQIDANLSQNYDTGSNRFYQNKEVTFDVLINPGASVDRVAATVAQGTTATSTVVLTSAVNIGYGWIIEKKSTNNASVIDPGVYVTKVQGTTITLSEPVSLFAGDQIWFNGKASATYALSVPFDSINNKFRSQIPLLDGVRTYQSGETIVFVKQELYPGNTTGNDGWNLIDDLFIGDDVSFDVDTFDDYEIVPGYVAHASDSTIPNKRAGIWRIDIADDELITLTFVKEIVINQAVKVISGTSHAGTYVVYDPVLKTGNTVPDYTPQNAYQNNSGKRTRFDGSTTRFYDHRDNYAEPETGDKYIKFPQIGVYK